MSHITPEDLNSISGQCSAEITDETTNSQPLPQLQETIDKLGTAGIETHVVIVNSFEDEGFTDVETYSNMIASECGWSKPNGVFVVISAGERKYDIYAQDGGMVSNLLEKGTNEAGVKTLFVNQLRDANSPWQADANVALDVIYTLLTKPEQPVEAPAVPTTEQSAKDTNIDLPLLPIGGGVTFAAVGTAVAFYVKKGRQFTKELNDASDTVERVTSKAILLTDTATTSVLNITSEEDFVELRKEVDALTKLALRAKEGMLNVRTELYALPRRKRTREVVRALYYKTVREDDGLGLDDDVEFAVIRTENIERLFNSAQQKVENIKTQEDKMASLFLILDSAYADLESLGYATEALKTDDQELQGQRRDIEALREKRLIDKPFEMMSSLNKLLAEKLEEYKKMPAWHKELQSKKEEALAENNETNQLTKIASEANTEMLRVYNPHCLEGMSEPIEGLQRLIEHIAVMAKGLEGADLTSKDIKSLRESEREVFTLHDLQVEANRLCRLILDRKEKLENLARQLPEDMASLKVDLGGVAQYLNEVRNNVSLQSQKDLETITSAHETFTLQLNLEKPDYLTIDKTREILQEKVKKLKQRLEKENDDALEKRAWLNNFEDGLPKLRSDLKTYEIDSDVTSATKTKIRELKQPRRLDSVSQLPYDDLQKVYAIYFNYSQSIDSLLEQAKQEMADAAEERARVAAALAAEEARRRRAQEEEEERQRQALNSSISESNSSHSSGGFDFSGSSHSFGDFGSSDSGSSHSSGEF